MAARAVGVGLGLGLGFQFRARKLQVEVGVKVRAAKGVDSAVYDEFCGPCGILYFMLRLDHRVDKLEPNPSPIPKPIASFLPYSPQ